MIVNVVLRDSLENQFGRTKKVDKFFLEIRPFSRKS